MTVSWEWLLGQVYERNDNLICGTHPWEPGCVCCFLIAGRRPRDSEVKHTEAATLSHTASLGTSRAFRQLRRRIWLGLLAQQKITAWPKWKWQFKTRKEKNPIWVRSFTGTNWCFTCSSLYFPFLKCPGFLFFFNPWPRWVKTSFFFTEEKKMKPVWGEWGRICKSKENITTEKSSVLVCYNKEAQTAWLTQQHKCISHSSKGWKSEIRVPVWSDFSEEPLLGCRPFYAIFSHWGKGEGARRGLFYKDTNSILEGSTFMT